MFLIVVYDVAVERVNKVRQIFAQYLHWVQNSVFEGELKESQYRELLRKLKPLIQEEDSVVLYRLSDEGAIRDRVILGVQKGGMRDPVI